MRLFDGEVLLMWPLAQHTITAGWLYSDGSDHHALDFRASIGTPVYAAEEGVVNWRQDWDGKTKTGNQSYGNLIRIQHANYNDKKLETYYAHLSSICVKSGDTVSEGQLIGYSGNTGNSTGPHLHFEVRLNGSRCNPLNWLDSDFSKAYDYVILGEYVSVIRPNSNENSIVIDVSKYQGNINWSAVPYPAIIRVGYRGYSTGKCVADEMFEQNISGAIGAGKLFGLYWFSQAKNAAEGREEAEYANKLIAGRGNGLPLFIDCEWANSEHNGRADGISLNERTDAAEAFCVRAKELGYIPGVYTFTTFAQSKIDYLTLANKYVGWLADTRVNYDTTLPRHIHQYGQGYVAGIGQGVDMNRIVKQINEQEGKPVNQLQRICIIGASDEIKNKAAALGLGTKEVTATVFDPASSGDAMTLWGMAQSDDSMYFSSYTEV